MFGDVDDATVRRVFRVYDNKGQVTFLSAEDGVAEAGFFVGEHSSRPSLAPVFVRPPSASSGASQQGDLSWNTLLAQEIFVPLLYRIRREASVADVCLRSGDDFVGQVSAAFFRFLDVSSSYGGGGGGSSGPTLVLGFYPARERSICVEAKRLLVVGFLDSAIRALAPTSGLRASLIRSRAQIRTRLRPVKDAANRSLFVVRLAFAPTALDVSDADAHLHTHLRDATLEAFEPLGNPGFKTVQGQNHGTNPAQSAFLGLLRQVLVAQFARRNMHEVVELHGGQKPPWDGWLQPGLLSASKLDAGTATRDPEFWGADVMHGVPLPVGMTEFEVELLFSGGGVVDVVLDPRRRAVAVFVGTGTGR